jgi:hypothetical protein
MGAAKARQQGRSERRGQAYIGPYVEPISNARTTLAGFFNSRLVTRRRLQGPARQVPETDHRAA